MSQWLIDNKLSHHLGKIESILFESKYTIRSNPYFNLTFNVSVIEPQLLLSILVLHLDQSLYFDGMAISVLTNASARLKFLHHKKEYFTQHAKKLFIVSLIQFNYDYVCYIRYNGLTHVL